MPLVDPHGCQFRSDTNRNFKRRKSNGHVYGRNSNSGFLTSAFHCFLRSCRCCCCCEVSECVRAEGGSTILFRQHTISTTLVLATTKEEKEEFCSSRGVEIILKDRCRCR
jgi:hypothetical protein